VDKGRIVRNESVMMGGQVMGYARGFAAVEAVARHLVESGAGAAVAAVDDHGELVAFVRTDGCPLASVQNAINKAFTAARERVESAEVGRRSREEGFPMTNFGDDRYTGWGGGVPVEVDGRVIGAIGVSGLSEADDIRLARIGVAAAETA
jgi:glc operon protein GlcG